MLLILAFKAALWFRSRYCGCCLLPVVEPQSQSGKPLVSGSSNNFKVFSWVKNQIQTPKQHPLLLLLVESGTCLTFASPSLISSIPLPVQGTLKCSMCVTMVSWNFRLGMRVKENSTSSLIHLMGLSTHDWLSGLYSLSLHLFKSKRFSWKCLMPAWLRHQSSVPEKLGPRSSEAYVCQAVIGLSRS